MRLNLSRKIDSAFFYNGGVFTEPQRLGKFIPGGNELQFLKPNLDFLKSSNSTMLLSIVKKLQISFHFSFHLLRLSTKKSVKIYQAELKTLHIIDY